jgi:hypothetical protein
MRRPAVVDQHRDMMLRIVGERQQGHTVTSSEWACPFLSREKESLHARAVLYNARSFPKARSASGLL